MKKMFAMTAVLGLLVWTAWLLESESSGSGSGVFEEGSAPFAFELSNLVEVVLPRVKLVKEKDQLKVSDINHLADKERAAKLVMKLNSLRVLKEIKVGDRKLGEFFDHQDHYIRVKTYQGERELRLGDVNEVTGNFYLQMFKNGKQKLFMAKDTSLLEGFYQNELEADLRKYLELKNLVVSGPFEFADNRLFGEFDLKKLKKITIDNKINRWFELDLSANQTAPPPPKGLGTVDLAGAAKRLVENSRFLEFFESGQPSFANQLSEVELVFENGKITAFLYAEFNGKKGLFVQRSDNPGRVYSLAEEGKEIFFENAQSFWDKSLRIPKEKLQNLKRFDFSLGASPQKMFNFSVPDVSTFKIEVEDPSMEIREQVYFNLLFNAILGSKGFEQAAMVVQHGEKELSEKLKRLEGKIHMRVFGKSLVFSFEKGKLILLDLENSLELVYPAELKIQKLSERLFFAFKEVQG